MEQLVKTFIEVLEQENRMEVVAFMEEFVKQAIEPKDFYTKFIFEAMSDGLTYTSEDEAEQIFQEHVRSNLVVHALDLYAIKVSHYYQANKRNEKVAVVCPEQELHDLGARVVADYIATFGYDVFFIGANTPIDALTQGIKRHDIKTIFISVTDYYNLVESAKLISALRATMDGTIEILIGGSAFKNNQALTKELDVDGYLADLDALEAYVRGKTHEVSI